MDFQEDLRVLTLGTMLILWRPFHTHILHQLSHINTFISKHRPVFSCGWQRSALYSVLSHSFYCSFIQVMNSYALLMHFKRSYSGLEITSAAIHNLINIFPLCCSQGKIPDCEISNYTPLCCCVVITANFSFFSAPFMTATVIFVTLCQSSG